mgnify:CR=1 FL=1
MDRRLAIKNLAAGALLVSAWALLTACQPDRPNFHGIDITGVDYARDLRVRDFNGQPRTLADFRGKVVVIFFGYTQCPDVCPTTMGEMLRVKQLLGADGDKLQVLFLSLDPERDTPEVLKAYMGSFDPGFLGLYAGSADELAALAKDFKVFYKKVEGSTPGSYTMDHTASSYLYDPQGRLRLFSRYGSKPEDVAADVRLLLGGA